MRMVLAIFPDSVICPSQDCQVSWACIDLSRINILMINCLVVKFLFKK